MENAMEEAKLSCKIISPENIEAVLKEAHAKFKREHAGKNADYIPYLANVNPNLFGISICLMNGDVISVGDADEVFGIESISKVPTAILAMKQNGADEVLSKIGADATGLPFDSVLAIVLENERSCTPLVNAGAIAACSMVQPSGDSVAKWDAIIENISDLCGRTPELIEELYWSEAKTNSRNKSIAWLLDNYNRLYDDPLMTLDLYTKQCSLGVTANELAIMGATIANRGYNPVTHEQVFDPDLAPKITSLITTNGFYQHTGDWLYQAGIPAKSGVGGGVVGIMPGLFGIAAFSPPLDEAGNSVRAQKAIRFVMESLDINFFDSRHLALVNC